MDDDILLASLTSVPTSGTCGPGALCCPPPGPRIPGVSIRPWALSLVTSPGSGTWPASPRGHCPPRPLCLHQWCHNTSGALTTGDCWPGSEVWSSHTAFISATMLLDIITWRVRTLSCLTCSVRGQSCSVLCYLLLCKSCCPFLIFLDYLTCAILSEKKLNITSIL